MSDKDFIQIDDPLGELQYINIDYKIGEHLHMQEDVPVLFMEISLKDDYPAFQKAIFKFRAKEWGRVLLSVDQSTWYETLLLNYADDLSYGAVSVFAKLELLTKEPFQQPLPELDIQVIK